MCTQKSVRNFAFEMLGIANEEIKNRNLEILKLGGGLKTNSQKDADDTFRNRFRVVGDCVGKTCPCKQGAPCLGLVEHDAYLTQEKDVVHLCPRCNEKMYTLRKGNPLSFIEHKCGCGHWGWLHLL